MAVTWKKISFSDHTHAGVGLTAWQVTTTADTAIAGDRFMADTTAAAFAITLPASPDAGDRVVIADYAGTFGSNNLTVENNGNNIMGLLAALVLDVSNVSVTLDYIDATQGWRIV